MAINIKKAVITLLCLFFFMSTGVIAAESQGTSKKYPKCHKCKDVDLKYLKRHEQIGFSGCYDCHQRPVKKKMKKKRSSKKENAMSYEL